MQYTFSWSSWLVLSKYCFSSTHFESCHDNQTQHQQEMTQSGTGEDPPPQVVMNKAVRNTPPTVIPNDTCKCTIDTNRQEQSGSNSLLIQRKKKKDHSWNNRQKSCMNSHQEFAVIGATEGNLRWKTAEQKI